MNGGGIVCAFEDTVDGLLRFYVAGGVEEPVEEIVEVVNLEFPFHLGGTIEEKLTFVGLDEFVEIESCEGFPCLGGDFIAFPVTEVADGAGATGEALPGAQSF